MRFAISRFGDWASAPVSPSDSCLPPAAQGPASRTSMNTRACRLAARKNEHALEDAQLIAGILRHLIGRPRRIEDDFDFDVAHAGKLTQNLLAVGDELRPRGAH